MAVFDELTDIDEADILSSSVVYSDGARLDSAGSLRTTGVQFVIVIHTREGSRTTKRATIFCGRDDYKVPGRTETLQGELLADAEYEALYDRVHAAVRRDIRGD